MTTVALIQARMGSTRLPGKMMLPLAGSHVIEHDIRRVTEAGTVDETVVATTDGQQDDIIARYAERAGATVFRGSEENVLERMFQAAKVAGAEIVVRITGDCPLIDPATIDAVVQRLDEDVDYATNILKRTFPRGLDVEAFTFESFKQVHRGANEAHHREHVTPYYREEPDQFIQANVTSDDVFEDLSLRNRTDLRLTLDEADDYEVLRTIYENVPFDDMLPIGEAIRYVDEHDLMRLNKAVDQKSI